MNTYYYVLVCQTDVNKCSILYYIFEDSLSPSTVFLSILLNLGLFYPPRYVREAKPTLGGLYATLEHFTKL